MLWIEVFSVFVVCHLVGDFALQTSWQAAHKRGGLGADPVARRALLAHAATYTIAFLPAFVWIGIEAGSIVLPVAALVFATHALEDDGRLLHAYIRRVKHTDPEAHPMVTVAVDQTFHVVVLLALALLAAG